MYIGTGKYIGTGSFGSESMLALYVLDIGTLFFPAWEGGEKNFRIGKAVKKKLSPPSALLHQKFQVARLPRIFFSPKH